jgi:hypothetical protein
MRRDGLAGFIDFHRHAAGDEMRGRSKSNRARANDGHRKRSIVAHAGTFFFDFVRGAGVQVSVAQGPATPAQQFSVRYPRSVLMVSNRAA